MTLKIWATALLKLSALLLAIGLVPLAAMALLFPGPPGAIPVLLSLSVAPLGALVLLTGLVLWAIGAVRK